MEADENYVKVVELERAVSDLKIRLADAETKANLNEGLYSDVKAQFDVMDKTASEAHALVSKLIATSKKHSPGSAFCEVSAEILEQLRELV